MTTSQLTPKSIAVKPSAAVHVSLPEYDAKRQLGVDRAMLHTTPVMTRATTQTYNSKGQPNDKDQD